ncbi:MAG TPA: glycosyl hydrolase, partial [Cytophagales bacterium]|nr:glycosyl hydrolase [Cytophagales bacterium]
IGLDFMHHDRGYDWFDEQQNLKDAKAWVAKNGIVTLMWHWRDPMRQTEGFYVPDGVKPADQVTDFDIAKVNDSTSAEYAAMVKDIDSISVRLLEFQANNIPVLWRPLHEAAGGWFWWGAGSGADLQKLWRLMYHRMVNIHGLRNLIWVWTNNGNDEQWYPGDAYVDIVGVDIYNVNGDHGSQVLRFNALNDRYAGKKMLALTEVEATPDVEKLIEDEAAWSWYMPWYGDYAHGNNPAYTDWALWNKMFASDYVLTVDEMPVIDGACSVVGVDDLNLGMDIEVYPTLVDDQLVVKVVGGVSSIAVYDGMGALVTSSEAASHNEVVLPFNNYKAGLYMVTVNNAKTFKVIKR